jgi:outer membrane protein OmpA-like peptidoglycan-associated protein
MKANLIRFVAIAYILAFSLAATAQQHYYVVLGTFSSPLDATAFTKFINDKYLETYNASDGNNLFHIYVLETNSREEAVLHANKLQRAFHENGKHATRVEVRNAYKEKQVAPLPEREPVTTAEQQAYALGERKENALRNETSDRVYAEAAEGEMLRPKGKFFKFTVTAATGEQVPARIHNVDLFQGRDLATYQTDSYIDILRSGNEPMTLVCGVFGYKLVEKVVDYTNPALTTEAYQDANGAWIIPYVLQPLEKGDVSTMYNVSFYKDAVVMLSSSKAELDQLVAMMQANPNYEIKIHGHCNGKKSRKIIAMGSSYHFFDINGSQEIKGSARQLSALRADAVKQYLIEQGIDAKRIKTYAWGGSYMLVKETHPNAKINDRIEIEVLKH